MKNKLFQNILMSIGAGVLLYFVIYGLIYTDVLGGVPMIGPMLHSLTPQFIVRMCLLTGLIYFCLFGLGNNGKSVLAGIFLFFMVLYLMHRMPQITQLIQDFADSVMSVL